MHAVGGLPLRVDSRRCARRRRRHGRPTGSA